MTFLDNGVTRGWQWYLITGGRQDYVTYSLGGREVTVEMDDTKMTPGSNLEAMWDWNHRSLLRYITEALSGVQGTVTDAESGDPLSARVFIAGHDADSSHVSSDTLHGAFFRLLPPGTWSLEFTCPGYEPYMLTADLTAVNPLLIRNISLKKRADQYPDPPETGLLIWPNPSAGSLSLLPPEEVTGEITVTLTTSSGAIITRFRTIAQPGIPVLHDFGPLSPGLYIITVRKESIGPMVRGKAIITRLITD
jgi:hypothetical protein